MRAVLLCLGLLAACGAGEPDYLSDAAKVGRRTYLAHCTACHGSDPGRDTPLGPALLGASEELLLARVREAGYPPGYRPKRDTRIMVPVPAAVGKVAELAAFLREYRPD